MAFNPYNLFGQLFLRGGEKPKTPYEEMIEKNPIFELYQQQSNKNEFGDVLREILNRQRGPASSAYSKFLQQGAPKIEDYQPTKLSRIGAMLSGFSAGYRNPAEGYGVAQSILEQPYRRALEQYSTEGDILREAARFEDSTWDDKLRAINTASLLDTRGRESNRQDIELINNLITSGLSQEEIRGRLKIQGKESRVNEITGNLEIYDMKDLSAPPIILRQVKPSTKEDIANAGTRAATVASATAPIIRETDRINREDTQQFNIEQQRRGFEHDKEMAKDKALSDPQKLALAQDLNSEKIRSLYMGDPSYKEMGVIVANPADGKLQVVNPVPDIYKIYPTKKQQEMYNKFVDAYNEFFRGIPGVEPKKYYGVVSSTSPIK